MIDPSEFPSYSSPLFAIARIYGIEIHTYADNTFSVVDYEEAKDRVDERLREMRAWLV